VKEKQFRGKEKKRIYIKQQSSWWGYSVSGMIRLVNDWSCRPERESFQLERNKWRGKIGVT
jgi:hypothetical protein